MPTHTGCLKTKEILECLLSNVDIFSPVHLRGCPALTSWKRGTRSCIDDPSGEHSVMSLDPAPNVYQDAFISAATV
jgi:hypothetical protein